jgi:hypothetical protein
MRTIRSFVAVVSTVALMACQTIAASAGSNRPEPVPAAAAAASQGSSTSSIAETQSVSKSQAPLAASGSRRTLWIIIGLVAAIAIVAVVIAGSDGGDSIY